MSEQYEYLRGQPSLFAGAHPDAMVVYEHTETEAVYFAVSEEVGAKYWHADGSEGRSVGLIGLIRRQLNCCAVRRRIRAAAPAAGLASIAVTREPAKRRANLRFDMIKAKAERVATPVVEPETVKSEPIPEPEPTPECEQMPEPIAATPVAEFDDAEFLDLPSYKIEGHFNRVATIPRITVAKCGIISLTKLICEPGDRLEIQISPVSALIRLRKTDDESKGLLVSKSRCVSTAKLAASLTYEDDAKSCPMELTLRDGWYYGTIPEVNRGKLSKLKPVNI